MSEGTIQMIKIIDNTQPAASEAHDRYLQPRQAQKRPPTSYESLLGDAIDAPSAPASTTCRAWWPTSTARTRPRPTTSPGPRPTTPPS
jgi:hypothetical protein